METPLTGPFQSVLLNYILMMFSATWKHCCRSSRFEPSIETEGSSLSSDSNSRATESADPQTPNFIFASNSNAREAGAQASNVAAEFIAHDMASLTCSSSTSSTYTNESMGMTIPFGFSTGTMTVDARVDGLLDQESQGSESSSGESEMESVQRSSAQGSHVASGVTHVARFSLNTANKPCGGYVVLIGSHPALGEWDASRARAMTAGSGNEFIAYAYFQGMSAKDRLEYKYALVRNDSTGPAIVAWERGANRVFRPDETGMVANVIDEQRVWEWVDH